MLSGAICLSSFEAKMPRRTKNGNFVGKTPAGPSPGGFSWDSNDGQAGGVGSVKLTKKS